MEVHHYVQNGRMCPLRASHKKREKKADQRAEVKKKSKTGMFRSGQLRARKNVQFLFCYVFVYPILTHLSVFIPWAMGMVVEVFLTIC